MQLLAFVQINAIWVIIKYSFNTRPTVSLGNTFCSSSNTPPKKRRNIQKKYCCIPTPSFGRNALPPHVFYGTQKYFPLILNGICLPLGGLRHTNDSGSGVYGCLCVRDCGMVYAGHLRWVLMRRVYEVYFGRSVVKARNALLKVDRKYLHLIMYTSYI